MLVCVVLFHDDSQLLDLTNSCCIGLEQVSLIFDQTFFFVEFSRLVTANDLNVGPLQISDIFAMLWNGIQ